MDAQVIERAYGILWRTHGSAGANAARLLLLPLIGKAGQQRGIDYALLNEPNPNLASVGVTGIHLKRIGDYVIVSAEIGGRWVDVINERHDGSFSHIVEPGGMLKAFFADFADAEAESA